MLIQPKNISPKPYYSYAFVQGKEAETIIVKGHLSMRSAKRAAFANMRKVRAEAENTALMGWAFGKVEDYERTHGIVV